MSKRPAAASAVPPATPGAKARPTNGPTPALYPAVDISEGRAVRLVQGDFGRRTDFGDPVEAARRLAAEGPPWLHVVDLDAARTGSPVNRAVVAAIARAVSVPLQAGGGVRDEEGARALLDAGVARVVVGTAAVVSPDLVTRLVERDPASVAVGLDYRLAGGRREVAIRGWSAQGGVELFEVLARLGRRGLSTVVVTAVDHDGTLGGPDLEGLAEVLDATGMAVIASGGVGSLADLSALASLRRGDRGLAGVVVGRALYDGRFSLQEALGAIEGPRGASRA